MAFFKRFFNAKLKKEFNQATKQLAYAAFSRHEGKLKATDTLSFITNDLKLLDENYLDAMVSMGNCVVMAVSTSIYVLAINWQVGLLFVACSFLPAILPKLTKKYVEESSQN